MASTPGVEPGPHWWEARALTLRHPLLPCSERQNGMNIKGPASNSGGHTNAFHTDLEAGGLSINYQSAEKCNLRRYLRCSKDHEIAECEQFISDEIQARWDIVKQNK